MMLGSERVLVRPVRRTLSNPPQLHGWWTSLKHATSSVTDTVGETIRDAGHAVATQVRKVPGGSVVTSVVGEAYTLHTDLTDKIGAVVSDVGDFMERQMRTVVKVAIRPIVNSFKGDLAGDSPFFLGADDYETVAKHLKDAKTAIVAASMAAGTAAGAALGSTIPGLGTATGGSAGAAITPSVVSELIDEIIEAAKKTKSDVTTSTQATVAPMAQAKTDTNWTPVVVGVAIVGGLYLVLKKGK